ncbi:MAG: L-aspartate oxidase [Planctomycetota bacterium]|nr:L-aspartate oxidase [Planctomycetota bacterium]
MTSIEPERNLPRRHLVSINPRKLRHLFTDVLVVGGGIAGCRAALSSLPGAQVHLVTKDKVQQSNSAYAQGGLAGVISSDDAIGNHVEDTLIAGAGLCHPEIVDLVIRESPRQIEELAKLGAKFDLLNGKLALGLEGGHSHPRIVHALGDATGAEVMRAMIETVHKAPNVEVLDQTFLIDLVTHEGRCLGALVETPDGDKMLLHAKQTILASGGCGRVWRETTNPPVATGDGIAAAYRAGCALKNLEFMQFHPTVLYIAGSSRFLISEALRGEGAYLRDKDGFRFMPDTDPRAERATRDIVSRAIVDTMARTMHPCVYLDMSHLDPDSSHKRFPGISRVCKSFGIDIARDMIPVRPGAHYMIGGITTDPSGRTNIPGLWAAGEVSCTGLHGANRLASNSLVEGLVFGDMIGRLASTEALEGGPEPARIPFPEESPGSVDPQDDLDIEDLTVSLRNLMVRDVGIVRHGEVLDRAQRQISQWCGYALRQNFSSRQGFELANLLTLARLVVHCAKEREESRGTHFRSDYPRLDAIKWGHDQSVPAYLPGL